METPTQRPPATASTETITAAPRRRPPSRSGSSDAFPASSLPSACPAELATPSRHDPYWGQLWAPGSQALWFTEAMARQRSAAQVGIVNRRLLADKDDALRLLTSNRGRAYRLAVWGAVDAWRMLSAQQLAAFAGSKLFHDPNYSTLASSFALGLIDQGTYTHPMSRFNISRLAVYRPSKSKVFDRLIAPTLTWPEWASITGGLPWSSAGRPGRNNILAAELGLRAAEYLPIGAVLGEKFSTPDLLCGTGLGKAAALRGDRRPADGTIVRKDGMRIAYELLSSASEGFEHKVRRWAQLLTQRPLETSGLTVLLIAAPHPDHARQAGADPRREIYRRMSRVLREFPGTGEDSPAARIGIAHWEDYFPAEHHLSERFMNLTARFALNSASGTNKWVHRDMLGTYAFTPWETFDATAVIDNASLLAATPHWMRGSNNTHLIGTPMDRANTDVPHRAPAGLEVVTGRQPGTVAVARSRAMLPARLRITA